jgi:spartin
MMAFSTVADGIDQAARNLLASTSTAASTVVSHKYGPEAGEVAKNLSRGLKNVALVYIDAAGVSRRAIVKSVAKGMVVGRMKGKGDLIVGGTDGSVYAAASSDRKEEEAAQGRYKDDFDIHSGRDSPGIASLGRMSPPGYGSGTGESINGLYLPEKKDVYG